MQWKLLGVALGLALAAAGCSRAQRHTLLTIFFEGVPPLEGEQIAGEPSPATAAAPPPRPGAEPEGSPPPKPTVVGTIHQPYKDRLCSTCHPFGSKGSVGGLSMIFSKSGILNEPVPALCYGCHADQAPSPETLGGAWMHGPVAAGACTFCHHPHSTQTSFLLRAKPAGKLCRRCHEPDQMHLGEAPSLEDGQDCTACHAGHRGESRFLLKASSPEEGQSPAAPPEAAEEVPPVFPQPEPAPAKRHTELRGPARGASGGQGG